MYIYLIISLNSTYNEKRLRHKV